ncbi:MAG TPA: hypothetical protein VF980_15750 [Thermoanaerobaculia bacterium]
MSCSNDEVEDICECNFCHTQFEPDVADRSPKGDVRCPQCGLSGAKKISEQETGPFVITRESKFR